MAEAGFDRVAKRFGEVVALTDFTLRVTDGEFITVLGPSGCGKSTLLRLTAGLEDLSEGTIRLGQRRIDILPPQERDVAMVFQSYALYPHMTVRANIEFPLRMHRVSPGVRSQQTRHVSTLLGLDELLERRPGQLSGGQRQRVALARALVRNPSLFLLDEPLSNLDARLRLNVRQHIRNIQRRLGVTTLYVTHDQSEAMTLGDRIVVMRDGRVQQVDTPMAVYESPANAFVAGFIGTPPMNLLPAHHIDGVLCVGEQRLTFSPALGGPPDLPVGPLTIGIRPEAFGAGESEGVVAVTKPATREVLGSETLVRAMAGASEVTIRLFGVARDIPRRVCAPLEAIHLFAAGSGERLGP